MAKGPGQPHGLGVTVKDWPTFQSLKNGLIDTGAFETAPGAEHRLIYVLNPHRPWIDLVPFGGIEQDGRMIAWPSDNARAEKVRRYLEPFITSFNECLTSPQ